MAKNIELYKEVGVKGLLMQGNFSYGGGGYMDEAKAYVAAHLAGEDIVIESKYEFIEEDGTIITHRRILNEVSDFVEFKEYFTGAFGTTEYQADMSGVTLGVGSSTMKYSYLGRKICGTGDAFVLINDIGTKIILSGEGEKVSEEGIAFSPVYHMELIKSIKKGEVVSCLKLEKAN